MSEPRETPTPAEQQEGDSNFTLGVVTLMVGVLVLFLSLLAWVGQAQLGEAPTSGLFQHARWVLAIGAGLVVLGLGLLSGRAVEFLGQRRGVEAVGALLNVLLGLALLLLVNYVFARHDLWRWDFTRDRLYSLSEEARKAVRDLPLQARVWLISAADPSVTAPTEVDTARVMLEGLAAETDKLTFKFPRPLDAMSRDEQAALIEELESPQIRDGSDLLGVVIKVGRMTEQGWVTQGSRTIPWRDLWEVKFGAGRGQKKTFLGEQKLLGALRDLVEPEKPKVYLLEGHDERRASDFDPQEGLSSLAQRLRDRHYQVEPLRLLDRPMKDVPEDARLVVLAGPRLSLLPEEAAALGAYLDRGGDALLFLEPVTDVRGGQLRWVKTGLEELLGQRWGVQLQERVVWLVGVDRRGQPVAVNTFATAGYGAGDHPIVAELARFQSPVEVSGARPLTLIPAAGVEQKPLMDVVAPPGMEEGLLAVASTRRPDVFDPSVPRETGGPFTLAVALERKIEPALGEAPDGGEAPEGGQAPQPRVARLMIVGDVDLATNAALGTSRNRNLELCLNAVSWALEREGQVVGKAARAPSYRLEMQPSQRVFFILVAFFGMPALAVALGVVAWLIRRG